MATILQAVIQYGPRLEFQPTTSLEDVATWVSMRTSINKSEVTMVLSEISEAILFYNLMGSPVKLNGVGTFSPSMDRGGMLNINFRPDMALKKGINNHGGYRGIVQNKARAGLTNEELKQLWDTDHPEDPLNIPAGSN